MRKTCIFVHIMNKIIENDGKDHINIYSKGQTYLGRLLSNFAATTIKTIDGEFASVESYWYWLNTDHPDKEKLRNLTGYDAKKLGRELRSLDYNDNPVFKLKISAALINKLMSHPKILDLFLKNNLPFKHYYVYNDKRTEPKSGKWILDVWEFLDKLVKNKT